MELVISIAAVALAIVAIFLVYQHESFSYKRHEDLMSFLDGRTKANIREIGNRFNEIRCVIDEGNKATNDTLSSYKATLGSLDKMIAETREDAERKRKEQLEYIENAKATYRIVKARRNAGERLSTIAKDLKTTTKELSSLITDGDNFKWE